MAQHLAIEAVTLRFGGVTALSDISVGVDKGEMLAIVGPNGAGKSSLLNCITGAYRAGGGKITFEHRDLTRSPAHLATRLGIARTFQHNELFPQLSVLENLLIGRQAHLRYGLLRAALFLGAPMAWETEQRRVVEEIVEFFELERYRKSLVGDLSYGVQKLVGIARAFVSQPRLLLLDEPSAGLNRQEKENLARFLLRGRHEFSPTIVWIEHDMQLVRDLADKVFVMHYGKELAYGGPDDVLADPKVIEAYVGSRARQ